MEWFVEMCHRTPCSFSISEGQRLKHSMHSVIWKVLGPKMQLVISQLCVLQICKVRDHLVDSEQPLNVFGW